MDDGVGAKMQDVRRSDVKMTQQVTECEKYALISHYQHIYSPIRQTQTQTQRNTE